MLARLKKLYHDNTCLLCSCLTSTPTTKSYVTVICCYFSSWKIQSAVRQTKAMLERHNAENLANFWEEKHLNSLAVCELGGGRHGCSGFLNNCRRMSSDYRRALLFEMPIIIKKLFSVKASCNKWLCITKWPGECQHAVFGVYCVCEWVTISSSISALQQALTGRFSAALNWNVLRV